MGFAALSGRGLAHTFSLARRRLHRAVAAAIAEHAAGDCLDCGSGRSPYRALLAERGASVTSVDVEDRSGEIDLLADIQEMPQIADSSFDTVLCTQVLEHVPRPWRAMAELARVLRPGGRLILSVPHLSAVHEAPHDFYRYTRHGLETLSAEAGLEVERIEPTGGLQRVEVRRNNVGSLDLEADPMRHPVERRQPGLHRELRVSVQEVPRGAGQGARITG